MNIGSWLAFIALGIIWGLPYFFIKLAVAEVPPLLVAFMRLALASAILVPLAWQRGSLKHIRAHKAAVLAFALVEFVIPFSTISVGERWIGSSVTGILIAAVPLLIALTQRLFGIQEHLGAWRIAGLLMGFLGVVALVGTGSVAGMYGWAGVACMLIAATGYALGPLIIQRFLGELDSLGPLAASLAAATLVLLVPAALELPTPWPSPVAMISIAVLGTVCTALAMLLMFYLVRHAGASRAAVITYINPVVAALLGVLVLHEQVGIGGWVAFALILLGCWLATRGAPAD